MILSETLTDQASEQTSVPFFLPATYYTDPAIYQLEMERIFHRSWNFAGYTAELRKPGDYLTCRVGEESIIVVRGQDQKLRAFYNVCRHRGHWLLEGAGNIGAITCPYHAWSYETNGELRFARASEQVPGFDKKHFCLKQVRVEVFCGFVFVKSLPVRSSTARTSGFAKGFSARFAHAVSSKATSWSTRSGAGGASMRCSISRIWCWKH